MADDAVEWTRMRLLLALCYETVRVVVCRCGYMVQNADEELFERLQVFCPNGGLRSLLSLNGRAFDDGFAGFVSECG
jgi:hypothetical protein